jgi:hypothetical protein
MTQAAEPPEAPSKASEETSRTSAASGMYDLMKAVAEVATVITGLSFICGWLYWSTYYSAFGLNPLELDFSAAVLSVSPIQVLVRDWQSERDAVSVMLISAFVVGLLLTGLFVHFRVKGYRRAGTILLVIALGMCSLAFKLGRGDAALDLGCTSRLPDVAFVTSTQDPLTQAVGAADCVVYSTLSCKLVLHVNGVYHYFVTPEPPGEGQMCETGDATGAGFPTAELPDSQVRMIRVQRRTGW